MLKSSMDFHCTTVITREGKWFVARCIELGVVSQGTTVSAAKKNLQEAVELYLEDMPAARRRISRTRPIVTTMHIAHG